MNERSNVVVHMGTREHGQGHQPVEVGVISNDRGGVQLVRYGSDIAWLDMTNEAAIEIAYMILSHALAKKPRKPAPVLELTP